MKRNSKSQAEGAIPAEMIAFLPDPDHSPRRAGLLAQIGDLVSRGPKIERPDRWTGYRIVPSRFEFWQGGDSRLHKRLEYNFSQEGWSWRRLQP